MIVVDASLAVKWYVRESLSTQALALALRHEGDIAVPDVFVTEVMGALVRRANIDKTLRTDSEASLRRFAAVFEEQTIKAQRSNPAIMAHAANLALDLGHPLKDCIYLALAIELGCDLVTADARFAAKAKGVWDRVRVLGE